MPRLDLPNRPSKPAPDDRFGAEYYRRYYGALKTRVASFADYKLRADLIAASAVHLQIPCGASWMEALAPATFGTRY